jgi:mannosyltransferase OCH1-like enzyme
MLNNIPHIIHQIWLQGQHNIPTHFLNNQYKIKTFNPNWKYILWDEILILNLIKSNNKWLDTYYQFQYLHQKVDFAKLIILYIYGGVFIDMDAYTSKSLDPLIQKYNNYDFIISKMNNNRPSLFNFLTCSRFSYCYNNGNIIAKPKTDILNYIINNINTTCYISNKFYCINKTTGPPIFNKLLDNYINNNDIKNKSNILILNSEYLEPCLRKNCNITNNTYIVHMHENSWHNPFIIYLNNLYSYNTFFIYLFNIIIILFLILFFIYLIKCFYMYLYLKKIK